ncbi:hypothetical protein CKAH01_07690 [Colletotrichum kahawae]|uniref:Uncharacterized protein n=1 Tax=Colletotrichum kahawae TaxID=34407 RepID=A0AAD9Y4P6_COLKA|nr:hypothetical protein CKAH01_07690 [Colletotrichum kahawae]
MLANMNLTVLLVALATAASALPSLSETQIDASKISKRTSVQFIMSNFRESSCRNSVELGALITPGQCHNIPTASTVTAQVYDPSGQTCVLKFWSEADCKGTAATWWMKGAKNDRCFDSASQGGIRKLSGAKSVLANCAEDAIPAS